MPKIPSLLEMLSAGLHFGHKTSKRHPSMDEYIYTVRNTVHIFNLEKTQEKLSTALDFVKKIASENGVILFLGTKKQAKAIVQKYAEEIKMPYVTEHWIGGTITNFNVIHKLIKKLERLEKQALDPDYEKKFTKKERHNFQIEKEKLEIMIGGIKKLDKVPDVIFIIDSREEKTAVREANRKNVAIVAICDTNTDASRIDYPIPANDDAIKSIEMITRLVAESIKEGQAETKSKDEEKKEEGRKENVDEKSEEDK